MSLNDTLTDSDGPPMTDSEFFSATGVLLTPFIAIPVCIIVARLVKYLWKLRQARKYGYGDQFFEDPLAELGLNLKRGYENTSEIRKIRKEQKRMMQEIEQRNLMEQETRRQAGTDNEVIFMKPLHFAEEYISEIRKQTKKTFLEKYSPDAVRRWVTLSPYSRVWMMFQVLVTVLAIINYVSLTYLVNKEDQDERTTIKDLDLFYSVIFLFDYVLSFYIADDRLKFYFNPMSLVDLISIVTPFVYLFVRNPTKYVWFLGLIRVFRATRILRTYRLLSFSQSEETRELVTFSLNFVNFVFFSASVINACETLVDVWDRPATLKNWHDSLYYIMVTFSTIGFGDLTPTSTISRMIVIVLIVMVVLYVPYQTGKIIDLYKSLNQYQRAKYSATMSHSHVILAGNVSYSIIIDFCRDFFLTDAGQTVVILFPQEPDMTIRRFLNHPFYKNRLEYLQGNVMQTADLNRANAQYASGLFLVNPKDTAEQVSEEDEIRETRSKDAQLLMQALVAKTAFPGLPVFAQVQDTRSKDLSNHCGCDRVLCIEELRASLLAANCLVPGLLALIPNLVHVYKDNEDEHLNEFWMQEYKCGIANQMYTFKVPPGLVGLRFRDMVTAVYTTYSSIIIGLVTSNAGFNQNPVRIPVEKDYILKNGDIAICITEGGEQTMLRICIHFKEQDVIRHVFVARDLEQDMDETVGHANQISPVKPLKLNESAFQDVTLGDVPEDLSNHIILCGQVSSRAIRHFVKAIRARQSDGNHKGSHAIVCIMETLPDISEHGIWQDILSHGGVYVCQGTAMKITTLKRVKIDKCNRMVIFSKSDKQQDVPDAISVFLVKMVQNEWPHVQFLVELIDGTNVKYFNGKTIDWDPNNLRMQSIINNYALSIADRVQLYQKFRNEGLEKTTFVYQLINMFTPTPDAEKESPGTKMTETRPTIKKSVAAGDYQQLEEIEEEPAPEKENEVPLTEAYLQKMLEEKELSESGLQAHPVYHFDKFFAAGMISTSSFMQSMLCQSYFRPYILDAVKKLIDHVIHLKPKESHYDKPYIDVAKDVIQQGFIPLGLYRNGQIILADKTSNVMPFVYTNCRPNDIVTKNDIIFAIQ
ncbi:hypothetical protein EDD86DRAFT_226803 [Gorgonomyces haynaldii]|nr:hypothetical protein EDD86DRAFT_226803 [Gorgonomyces haynaldii]